MTLPSVLPSPGTPAVAKPLTPASIKAHSHHRGGSAASSRHHHHGAPHSAPTWLFDLIEASQAGW